MPSPRIAIIGGGPGGLTLARILQRNQMECTVFELDKDRFARGQGGLIDLHGDSGQLALRNAGLLETFQKYSLAGADAMKLVKADGTVAWDENDMKHDFVRQDRDRPEIDRGRLRDILIDSLDPASIRWNSKIIRVVPNQSNDAEFDLHFADHAEEGFDLVVGADGAWSKVRPLVSDQVPEYSGVVGIELNAHKVSEKHQWLSDYVGRGSLFMFDEGRHLICQRNGEDGIRAYASVRQPETWIKDSGIDWENNELARKQLIERYYSDCHEDLKRVIAEASDGLTVRTLHMLPVGFRWSPRPGVTLLGDAAHLMTPFAGVGVNVAMTDSMCLAEALLKQRHNFETDLQGSLKVAIEEYEEPMFVRAKKFMELTYQGLQGHFSTDGIDNRVRKLQARMKQLEEMKKAKKAGN
ncbi:monooxygenase fad-binding protein [Rutstroemia sp. NJR-2017a BBW]|nr:monooxygenase fad-binding protein [Rutstroemia sp. NJR-2017a BBW]